MSGQVWDLDLDEEYTAFRAARAIGRFVGRVREEYGQILKKMAQECFVDVTLATNQGQRLIQYLQQKYGDTIEPFSKFPGIYSFRNPLNQKWYALFARVAREKLEVDRQNWTKEELKEKIELVNLKIDPTQLTVLLAVDGVYPSYHMNKKNWVSIILDEKVSDDFLFSLVDNSRQLTIPRGFQNPSGPDMWVIPANPKMFDIDAEFANSKQVYWRQKGSIQTGDLVAMYITAPVRAIRYLCRVLEANIPAKDGGKNRMLVELLTAFDDELFSAARMAELGVKAVRGPRRLTKELMEAIQIEYSQKISKNSEKSR